MTIIFEQEFRKVEAWFGYSRKQKTEIPTILADGGIFWR
jgi:hypothetical protein